MECPATTKLDVTFIGAEGVGKTTMCQMLAPIYGGVALSVPPWPSLNNFLQTPHLYAYNNQVEAMDYTVNAYISAQQSGFNPIFADNCPDRIHLIHSWMLLQEGMLSACEWESLERQYLDSQKVWGSRYVYLYAGVDTLTERLVRRNRPEDLTRNIQVVSNVLERWVKIISDDSWRSSKNILELSSEAPLVELSDRVGRWLGGINEYVGATVT